ncbi:MAG: sensor histidine kinase [Lachnospiraceae bacterium]
MRKSIKIEVAVVFFGILFFTFFLCWGINTFFLERFYLSNKADTLYNAYATINEAGNNNTLGTAEFLLNFEQLCENGNLSILVADSSMQIICASKNETEQEYQLLYRYIYGLQSESGLEVILDQTDMYTLSRTRDPRFNSDYIQLIGIFENGNFFIMRSAIASIQENVEVSNRFLAYIATIIIFFSIFVIWYVTDRITRPLQSLVQISEQMEHLNFDAKYPVEPGGNEIDLLGERMNRMSEKLEQTISDLKTANNELQSDIEQKIQIDEMRKEFLSNVSHELKTPLALIQGYAEGLKECINDDQESREFYCDVIIDESMKMNRMVQKLLTLNQIEFGNDVVVMARFNITALIQGIIQSTSILAEQKEVQVTCNVSSPVYVWADEFKIEEVVTNFMSNALNHVDYEKRIEVKIVQKTDRVRVSVFNTGDPIPEEDLDRIWVKFYKVDKARTREYGGSGIGLSIVKAIMDSMNRDCGVINYDNGVEFWFELDAGNGSASSQADSKEVPR